MSQTSKILCLSLPIVLRQKIDHAVSQANKGKGKKEQLSRAQFIRDCIEFVLRQIEDGQMYVN